MGLLGSGIHNNNKFRKSIGSAALGKKGLNNAFPMNWDSLVWPSVSGIPHQITSNSTAKTSKVHMTGPSEWNPPMTSSLHTQRTSNAESTSMSLRLHELCERKSWLIYAIYISLRNLDICALCDKSWMWGISYTNTSRAEHFTEHKLSLLF